MGPRRSDQVARDDVRMSAEPFAQCLEAQAAAIARRQGQDVGVDPETMRTRVRSGRWQRLQRGVYAAFSGDPARETVLWAALLRAGPGAVLSHQTAAERDGLIDEPSAIITITVPASRHPAQVKIPGVIVHRSDAILHTRHPAMLPPCTRVEDTVLDLIQMAPSFDDAYAWVCRAIGRRRTTADRIRRAMDARKKMRWRRELVTAIGDAGEGALSLLEYRYVRRVERPHGLPAARRQARIRQRTGNKYLDNLYGEYGVCSELDGTAAHPADEQWRDKRRDNAHAVQGIVTLRFGLLDLGDRSCQTAADVAAVLRWRGWKGDAHPCSRQACALRDGTS
jgi:predicted transcriptional regulator of viral defense system